METKQEHYNELVVQQQKLIFSLQYRVDDLENNAKNVQTILEEHAKDTSQLCREVREMRDQIAGFWQSSYDEKERVDHLKQRIEAHAEMLNEHEKWREKRSDFYADLQGAANWDEPGDPDWNINNPLAKASDQVQFTPFPEIIQDLSCQIAQMKRDTEELVTELEQLRKFKGHCKDRLPILRELLDKMELRPTSLWILERELGKLDQ